MAVRRSDDLAAGFRYLYQGPAEFQLWPWAWPQWGMWLLTIVGGWVVIGLLLQPPAPLAVVLGVAAFLPAWIVAGPITSRLIEPDTGLRYWIRTLRAEAAADREAPTATVTTTTIPVELFAADQEDTP